MHGIIRETSHMQLREEVVKFLQSRPYTPEGTHLGAFLADQYQRDWEEYLQAMGVGG